MAKKGNDRSETSELYNKVFDKLVQQTKHPETNPFGNAYKTYDPDNPIDQKMKKIDENVSKDGSNQDLYEQMLLPEQVRRRIKAAIKYEEIARDKLKYKGGMKGFHDFWVYLTSLVSNGSYDSADIFSDGIMAAAIWILDEINLADKMDELYPLVADASEEDCSDFLAYKHPAYDSGLISAVINTIRHRNDDLYKPDGYRHNWTDPWTTSPLRDISVQSKKRKNFEEMISLLDKDTVKAAKRKYEDKVWEFYQLTSKIDEVFQKEIKGYENGIVAVEKKLQETYMKQLTKITGKESVEVVPLLSPLMISEINQSRDMNDAEIAKLEDEKDHLVWEQRKVQATAMADFTTMALVDEREMYAEECKGIIPDQYLDELIRFSVDDPYETLFALLALLDDNSNIPWLCYGSCAVFYTAMDQLPTTRSHYLHKGRLEEKISRGADPVYQMEYPSDHRFENTVTSEGDPVVRKRAENLAQKIYAQSYTLLPRLQFVRPDIDVLLKGIGAETEREKIAYELLIQGLMAGFYDLSGLDSYLLLKDIENGESESTDENIKEPEATKEISELRHRNTALNKAYRDEAARARELQDECDGMKTDLEEMRQELAELRNIVFNRENEVAEEETEEETKISLPYSVKKRTVSFGGHPGWLKSMKEYLPDVRFISPDMLPNTMLLRAAEVIWIQPNCISHSDYYRIINVAKEYKVKIHYYAYDSATKCAKQLAMEDK